MIRIEGLSKRFGAKAAVDGLDLEVKAGELFCFLGPNGAGKTTTIKVLTGLLRPTTGRAAIGGHDVVTEAVAAKRLLGYVPDQPFLYDKLTVRETLRFVAGLYSLDGDGVGGWRERSEALLERFRIRPMGDQLVESLSHGMRQKLSFAACFLHQPQVVLVDEPWVGLDPKSIHEVKRYLQERARDGLTVFMSTHTLSIAEEVADRIGILHGGRLVALGTVAEIKALARRPGSLEDVFLELTQDDGGELGTAVA